MAAPVIKVHGLKELRRDLEAATGRSPREIQVANQRVAELVAVTARGFAPKGEHEGGGDVAPLASEIKARSTAGKAFLVFGGTRAPHGAVVNFGGTIPRRGATKLQKAAFAKARKGKRSHLKAAALTGARVTHVRRQEHIYRAIEADEQLILHSYTRAVERITRRL